LKEDFQVILAILYKSHNIQLIYSTAMHLDDNERILKVYYRHYYPYFIRVLKLIGVSIPFYFLIFILGDSLGANEAFLIHVFILLLFTAVLLYLTLLYWLDRLIVTNKRLIYIDWKYLTAKTEYETELKDIQDITSMENGLFAIIPALDFGTLLIKTSSNDTTIQFHEAPNPNGIKGFIQDLIINK
jgi:hypothetical protein